MSYHQTYRTVSNPVQPGNYGSHSPAPSVHRKPANYASSLRSSSPMPPRDHSVATSRSDLRSPSPHTPLNSNPPNLPLTPSRTPDPTPQDPDQPHYQPTALAAVTNNSTMPSVLQSTAPATMSVPAAVSQTASSSTTAPAPAQARSSSTSPSVVSPDRPLYGAPVPSSSSAPAPPASHSLPAPRRASSIASAKIAPVELKPLTKQEIDAAFKHCLRIQSDAVSEHGKLPFAALLLGPDNVSVLASHNSVSHFQPAVAELARMAALQYGQNYLAKCTMVSTWEPCALGAGTVYWTGIGRVLYAATELKLHELTGANNPEYLTLNIPCRTIFNSGQRKVEVIGPIGSWEAQVVEDAARWWRDHPGMAQVSTVNSYERSSLGSRDNSGLQSKRTSITVYNPEDSLLGSIGEDGEYQADLKIDWMM